MSSPSKVKLIAMVALDVEMATEEAVVRVARLEGSGERKKSTNLESNFVGIRILNFKTLKLKH